jgi:hypothetical protein
MSEPFVACSAQRQPGLHDPSRALTVDVDSDASGAEQPPPAPIFPLALVGFVV